MTSANHDLLRLRDAVKADDAGPCLPAPQRQHLASPMVVDLHRPTVGELMMMVPDGAGRTLCLVCWRLSGSPFGERERFYLQLLRPHLIELYRRRERSPIVEPVLTNRQLEVVGLVRAGLTNAQIGRRLEISEGTVRTHLRDIFERLGVTSRTAAVVRAESVLGPLLDSVDPSRAVLSRWSA